MVNSAAESTVQRNLLMDLVLARVIRASDPQS